MAGYSFADDEHVVLRAQEIHPTETKFSMGRGSELMLTNRNVVYIRKGLTGKVKGYDVYPLADIRMVDGKPQVRLDDSKFMENRLELSLKSGVVSFVFGSLDDKKEVRQWVNAIYELITGEEPAADALGKKRFGRLTDEESIADTVGRVFGSFENALQRKRQQGAQELAWRCASCDGSVKGKPGETLTCPYCGSYVTIPVG